MHLFNGFGKSYIYNFCTPERIRRDRADSRHAGGSCSDIPAAAGLDGGCAHIRERSQLRRVGGGEEHVQWRDPQAVLAIGEWLV